MVSRQTNINPKKNPLMEVIWATPLYEFLRQCNASPLPKRVLDCGAGGSHPPLSLFYQHGYQTCGIEIALDPLFKARDFCRGNRMPLNIWRGDMRHIPFASQAFSFVYSFNAIFFMTKPDIRLALSEIKRVLRRGGLFYVNFISVDDPEDRGFCLTTPVRQLLQSEGFAKHEDHELDVLFKGCTILHKEKRYVDKLYERKRLIQVTLEYIARKK